jgi:penicillin V acylase-like amidase (Ntn superfamily)
MSLNEYLSHILDETEYITRASKGLSKQKFMTDETLKTEKLGSVPSPHLSHKDAEGKRFRFSY